MTIQELFNFLVDSTVTSQSRDEYLERMKEVASSRPVGQMTDQEKIDEEVFKNIYIPKTLDQVSTQSLTRLCACEFGNGNLYFIVH